VTTTLRRDPAPCWLTAWIAFSAACSTWAVFSAVTQPGISTVIQAPVVIGIGTLLTIWWLRQRRHMARPRAALLALLRNRDSDSVWLNRDEHRAFQLIYRGWGPGRLWTVYRFAEDDILNLSSGGQEDLLFLERYVTIASLPTVLRMHESVLATPPDGETGVADAREVPDGPGKLVTGWRTFRWLSTGALSAAPGEIQELTAELSSSEPVPQ
jgi:hypothetical protein